MNIRLYLQDDDEKKIVTQKTTTKTDKKQQYNTAATVKIYSIYYYKLKIKIQNSFDGTAKTKIINSTVLRFTEQITIILL